MHTSSTREAVLEYLRITMNTDKKIIFDLGSNNGSDIPYYLKKSDLVIAVEANPALCNQIQSNFSSEIRSGRLVVENCVLTSDHSSENVPFYIHKANHVLSQFPQPGPSDIQNFLCVDLPSISVKTLVEKHGEPFYVKIDVEHYDQQILRALFSSGIYPPYISAESHSAEVFSILVSIGLYKAFKLVDGPSVSARYHNYSISVGNTKELYSFPHHSAGPFGNDVRGPWMTTDNFFSASWVSRSWLERHSCQHDRSARPRLFATTTDKTSRGFLAQETIRAHAEWL
jgi:FkbM family methyltransferase